MTEAKSIDYSILKSPSSQFWKETLSPKITPQLNEEIDVFEREIELKKQGKIDDKVFAETRLRRGAYGQRYDNGHRHDGKEDRQIPFPDKHITKGPNTLWDAPGMIRIKIPFGGLNTEQLLVLADTAEEYSDDILHVTTRQDIQIHFVHIEDTPALFRRLAAVGITTREACGNSVRNITACPFSGVCQDEGFDTTPYAGAMMEFLLGHPDTQDFGRKFKISFSGCQDHPCALSNIHDMGLIAKTRQIDGTTQRGFAVYVGGGLGALPFEAKLFDDFVAEEEILPLAQAISRVFARHGEKQKRNRARIKFLISDWGIEKFKEEVLKERQLLKPDKRWTHFLESLHSAPEQALKAPGVIPQNPDSGYQLWLKHNVKAQRQTGYAVVTLALTLGDITSNQTRQLVQICQKYIKDTIRATVEQNLVLRWVSYSDLYDLYQDLKAIHLAEPAYDTIVDVTSCPGTDTCKLGVSASRGLAGELHTRLAERNYEFDTAVKGLKIKISGCFNSCGQHHVADIGFYGVSRKVGDYMVPHFQLVLGGQWTENAASYGQPMMAIPSKSIPQTVDALTDFFVKERQGDESFQAFVQRVGKGKIKQALDHFTTVPSYQENPDYYTDWADVREYSKKDIGVGECAGEVVSLADFSLTAADRELFEAQLLFDNGQTTQAAQKAFQAMVHAAQGLVKIQNPDVANEPEIVAAEFRKRFHETELFHDPFAGDKFANYFFKALHTDLTKLNKDQVRQFMEESHLFIEAAYSCHIRITMKSAPESDNEMAEPSI